MESTLEFDANSILHCCLDLWAKATTCRLEVFLPDPDCLGGTAKAHVCNAMNDVGEAVATED